jgi:hypothetical protein
MSEEGRPRKSTWLKFLTKMATPKVSPDTDFTGLFAIPNNEPWWMAVHQILDEAEAETTRGARNRTANPNLCIAAVGAGEGVELVRQKLLDKRRLALQHASKISGTARVPSS